MDPLSAAGLAANVVQFLELGGKLVSGATEIYHSTDGALSSNRMFEEITKDLLQISVQLEPKIDKGLSWSCTGPDQALISLLKSCKDLALEFLKALEKVKAKRRNKCCHSIQQALKTIWRRKDIERYETQLNLYRSQIAIRLLAMLT